MDEQPPPLGEQKKEATVRAAVTALKAAANAIPIAGPLLSVAVEIALNETIPNYRVKRLEDFVRYLDNKVDGVKFEQWVKTEEGAEHFEEAIRQAAKSRGEKRREYLANLVAEGMAKSQLRARRARQMLRLIEMIDDDQIIILASVSPKFNLTKEFKETHEAIIGPFPDEQGNTLKTEKAHLKYSLENHLISIGLLYIKTEAKGYPARPISKRTLETTPTGAALLEFIGIVPVTPSDL